MQTVYPACKELQLLAVEGLISRVASEIYMQLYHAVSFSVGTLKGSLLSQRAYFFFFFFNDDGCACSTDVLLF